MSAIETVLWPGIREIIGPDAVNAGITVNKGGYHSTRAWLRANKPNDYSIQLDIDQQGPSDEGSAIDVTFKTAQAGNYSNISKYCRRLFGAGVEHDKRAYPLREFYGNTDSDSGVEGWSYYRDEARSSDPSHAWHFHLSIFRKFINDAAAMRSILSILRGDDNQEEEDMAISDDDAKKIARFVLAAKIQSDKTDFDNWTVNHILDWTARNSKATSRAIAALAAGQDVAQADLDALQAALEEHDAPPA